MKRIGYVRLIGWALFAVAPGLQAATATLESPKLRLGDDARPLHYTANLVVVPDQETFSGEMTIELSLARSTRFFWLHGNGLTVANAFLLERGRKVPAKPARGGEEFLGFDFGHPVGPGKVRLCVGYHGTMPDKDSSGLFRRKEGDQWYAATQFEPTWARKVFPCFDEPSFKVPWQPDPESLRARGIHRRNEPHLAYSAAGTLWNWGEGDGVSAVPLALPTDGGVEGSIGISSLADAEAGGCGLLCGGLPGQSDRVSPIPVE